MNECVITMACAIQEATSSRKEKEEERRMSEWISVDDSRPNEGCFVVFASFYKSLGGHMELESVVAGEFYNGRFHVDVSGIEARNYDGGANIYVEMTPTHWMPLPETPECKQ